MVPVQPPQGGAPVLSADEQVMLASSAATSYQNMSGYPGYVPAGQKLGFWGSIQVGFRLLPVCWSVLAQEAVLLVIPLVVLLVSVLALLGYAAAFGGIGQLVSQHTGKVDLIIFFPVIAFMMAISSVGQGVIVAAATDILSGKKSSFGNAWLAALTKLPQLVGFGVVYAAERTLTGMLRGKRSWSPTTIAANAIDRAWDFATFLAIPVLLYENVGVFESVRRSGKLVAKRWGVQLTARSALGLALFVCAFPVIALGMLVAFGVSVPLGIAIVLVALLAQIAFAGALTGVLSAALYRFAVTGLIAPGFRDSDMWAVFSRR
ncbi:MAG: DUF6159 family protein [Mycobacteriales bacterium]